MKQYTPSHEWIVHEDGKAIVGLSREAIQELGEIVYIELPKLGQLLRKEESAVIVESTKAATDIASPVSGRVVRINEALTANLPLLNRDPEGEGWLYEVELES